MRDEDCAPVPEEDVAELRAEFVKLCETVSQIQAQLEAIAERLNIRRRPSDRDIAESN